MLTEQGGVKVLVPTDIYLPIDVTVSAVHSINVVPYVVKADAIQLSSWPL